MNGYCSDRQEFGVMTFANAWQKCRDEGLELPVPGSVADVNTVNAGSAGQIWLGIAKDINDIFIRRVFT